MNHHPLPRPCKSDILSELAASRESNVRETWCHHCLLSQTTTKAIIHLQVESLDAHRRCETTPEGSYDAKPPWREATLCVSFPQALTRLQLWSSLPNPTLLLCDLQSCDREANTWRPYQGSDQASRRSDSASSSGCKDILVRENYRESLGMAAAGKLLRTFHGHQLRR